MKTQQFKVGDYITPIKNTGGHNYKIGKTYQIIACSGGYYQAKDETGFIGNNIAANEMELTDVTKEDLLKTNKNLQERIDENNSIIQWMEETGSKTYSEMSYKVWQVLTLFEQESLSKIEKTKKIAELIK